MILQIKKLFDMDGLWADFGNAGLRDRYGSNWQWRRRYVRYLVCVMFLGCLSGTAYGAGLSQGVKFEIIITFGLMALPVVGFRLYFTLGRAGIMKKPLLKRFFQLALFLLSEIVFYSGFVYLGVLSTHWDMGFGSIVSFLGFLAMLFSLVQHHLFGPKDDGIPPRLIYAVSLFAYPAMVSLLI